MRVSIESENAESTLMTITDLTGKKLISKNINVISGSNNIEIPVEKLPKGTYFVTIRLNNETLVQKITKL